MILDNIVSQHAEEAAFLWLLRDSSVSAPHYKLSDLSELESRIDAHLDGLRVAGETGWVHCQEQLNHSESGEVFTAAYIALDGALVDGLNKVLEVVHGEPTTIRGLISALGWVEKSKLQGHVVNWLKSDTPLLRLIGLSACAIQRVDCGAYLNKALDDDDAGVRARALRSIGEIRRQEMNQSLREHMHEEDETCRFWSVWSAAMMGDEEGTAQLVNFAEADSIFLQPALELLMRRMDNASAVSLLRTLSQNQAVERAVVQASGYFGDSASVPWLIEKMKSPDLSRVAGEAFSLITGLDLAYQDLESEPPEDFQAGPSESPEDDEVDLDQDEDLPWPDIQSIMQWWSLHQADFPTGVRRLCGKSVKRAQCLDILQDGFQRQRQAAAMELAMFDQQQPLFNTSATAQRQSELINLAPS
ncbi:MAG: TIGR02270 family protein [Candidatus Thiodiazotropha sp. L084R]